MLVKRFIPLLSIMLSMASYHKLNAQDAGKYKVSGHLENLTDQTVYLSTSSGGKEIVDSVLSKGGNFTFSGTAQGTLMYGLRANKKYLLFPVGKNEQVTLSGDVNQLNAVVISGNKDQQIWSEWQKGWQGITSRAGKLYKKLDSLGKDGDRTYVDQEFKKLDQRLIDSVESIVKRHPSSAIAPYIIIDRFINYPNPAKAASTFNLLQNEAKASPYGKQLAESLATNAKTAIGTRPDFTLPDRDGKPFKLSSLKGKVVLVDFWASWCVPCRKENPNLVKAYASYHQKGFEIVGVSLDNKKEAWLKAIAADQLNWLHVSDLLGWKSDLAAQYGIKSIPTSFLIDASGKIIMKDLRGEELGKKLAAIYK